MKIKKSKKSVDNDKDEKKKTDKKKKDKKDDESEETSKDDKNDDDKNKCTEVRICFMSYLSLLVVLILTYYYIYDDFGIILKY